jgi:hypothetical protein
VHAGLHHCASPNRALLEMYRAAKKAAIVFEARDSLLMRLATWLRFNNDFELQAVTRQGLESGGFRNGPIPNFVYRWTEREVTKVVRAADPAHVESIRFFYGLRGNEFGFVIFKTGQLRDWMELARRPAACFPREGERTRPGLYARQGAEGGSHQGRAQATEQATDRRIAGVVARPSISGTSSPSR